jgi:cytidylate kinase
MELTTTPLLIIITGPVGARKSTIGLALARSLRRPDFAVAVIDLDQMYSFVRQQEGYDDPAARARHGAAALANCLFTAGMSAVIVEGEFLTAQELGVVTAAVEANVVRCFFTLKLSYERALERVQGDPSGGASKDPAFLKWLYENFAQALPFLEAKSVVVDTDKLTQDQVVARLAAQISKHEHLR